MLKKTVEVQADLEETILQLGTATINQILVKILTKRVEHSYLTGTAWVGGGKTTIRAIKRRAEQSEDFVKERFI